jgi:predicted Zn-dependent protease/transglutaminase-like putative cysteine protease
MRQAPAPFALVLSLFSAACIAQAPPKAATANPYANEAVVIERMETRVRMNADGTGTRNVNVIMRVQSEGTAQQFGDLTFPYASANETLNIKYVRVTKPDGTVVETPSSNAIEMPSDVTRQAPLYSDLKEKHLPVRSVSSGDTLEYEIDTSINKAEAPGQFWGTQHFTPPGSLVVLAEVFTLDVPADKYVQVWSPNHKPTITEQNGRRIYSWDVPQLVTAPKNTSSDAAKSAPKDPDEDADGRKLPSVAWTTFHTWAEVGNWYRGLELTQSQPTDAIRAKASDLTKDAKTPEDQVRALYEYVSTQTRYVGIDFGIGRYQPHLAAEILANQYGDCKDKDTLLESLLRAKGFSPAPALIGAGIAPVPEVPSPAVFNHVITTVDLPGGRIWLDSTPDSAPFRYLSAVIRDQKALVVPAGAPAELVSTPANPPYPFAEQFQATGTLDDKGQLTGSMTATYHDDVEVAIRMLARSIAPAQWDKASQYVSSMTGFGGTTSNTQFKNANEPSAPIVMTYDYSRKPFGDWDDLRIVPLFPALEFSALDSDKPAPEEDIQLGAPRKLTAISTIHLPTGYQVNLPDPIHVKTDFATFDKTYKYEKGEIVAEREIVVLKSKIPKDDWKSYQTFTKDISLAGESWIQLIPPEKTTTAKVSPPSAPNTSKVTRKQKLPDGRTATVVTLSPSPGAPPAAAAAANPAAAEATAPPANESAAELMQDASEKMRSGDWSSARQALDQVKAKDPKEQDLWTFYAFIASEDEHNSSEAVADLRKELDAHPDNLRAVAVLAQMQLSTHDGGGARHTLENYLRRHPDNAEMSLQLSQLEINAGDFNAALKTLDAATKQHPDNRALQSMMSTALVHLGRNQEAAAAAESVLDGATDPGVLNDAAYTLSETGIDLNVAEAASRKSITAQEEKSAEMTTEQANAAAFANSTMIEAGWDTLGWILFREGKNEEAESYLEAAWRASQIAEVGYHLGQLYEAMGKKKEAATAYALAEAAIDNNTAPDISGPIKDNLARLKTAGIKPAAGGVQALQDLRTYKVLKPKDVSGWGTFRLEVTTAGVIESQQMTGSDQIAGIKPALAQMKFAGLVPAESKAHLLLSAVISCGSGKECQVVLVPNGGLQTERQ